ncbi:MAG TPA: tetratricopeptide repeat protein [Lacipirellulaceae bacterium]|nr:tetratricopeptide repeat protein [Lacipirellulaceae bacterium]
MSNLQRTICVGLLLGSIASTSTACAADNPRQVALQINKANDLLRQGDVDAAIGAYEKVQKVSPNRDDLSYDMAVAEYRKGDVAAAERLFQSAATSDDDSLAAKARYNLGNCDYASAIKVSKTDAPTAIKGLGRAIANYRSALGIDPNDADARTNLELAARLRDTLREQQKAQQQQRQQQQQSQQKRQQPQQKNKQQQSQNQQQKQNNDEQQSRANPSQQQQQSQSSSNENKQQQQNSSSNNQQQNKDQKKSQQSQQNKPQSQQQQNGKSESKKESSQQLPSTTQQQTQPNKSEKPADKTSQQQKNQSIEPQTLHNHQQRSQKQQTAEKPAPADQQGKQAPKGKLEAASKQDKSNNDENKRQAIDADSATDAPMTRQEAEKMLQAIRDRDMLRRLQRQAAERDQHVPVDRDW